MENDFAFPHEDFEYDGNDQYKVIRNGLTKREYFAAIAMQGLLASNNLWVGADDIWEDKVSEQAIKQADSLLQQIKQANI